MNRNPDGGSALETPEETIDPAAALRLYRTGTARAYAASTDVSRLFWATWGLAWLLGYLCLWAGARLTGSMPPVWAFIVFYAVMAAGIVISAVFGIRSSQRLKGPSALAGTLYGWSWFLGFGGGMTMVALFTNRYDLPGPAISVMYNAVAALIAGALYMAGAAAFKVPSMFLVGVVFIVLSILSAVVPLPAGFLVMAFLGGGLMLLGFIVATWRGRRHQADR